MGGIWPKSRLRHPNGGDFFSPLTPVPFKTSPPHPLNWLCFARRGDDYIIDPEIFDPPLSMRSPNLGSSQKTSWCHFTPSSRCLGISCEARPHDTRECANLRLAQSFGLRFLATVVKSTQSTRSRETGGFQRRRRFVQCRIASDRWNRASRVEIGASSGNVSMLRGESCFPFPQVSRRQ